ncbi:uncharacterized protein GGS22DRAFT_184433 [Annulohypoxylon maeteangense]|uniref:uncharacterized protein n=1 Tax=Annulohypoxylon maeteangense TaxID=1927788 RepID=UPI0020079454|nr:uncharacterized protein GGS22DRAFT_184433 [Annulohypoxylon maeteangense]KAI0888858.1 hypothetical protein GGS22DRAFT_184433 [Annulohypoxylon maeteangense]
MSIPTDLYVHRVRLKPGLKPWNRSKRRHWTPPQKYWLTKLTQECLDAGLYESSMAANGHLSDWIAQPVLVAKRKASNTAIPIPPFIDGEDLESARPGKTLKLRATGRAPKPLVETSRHWLLRQSLGSTTTTSTPYQDSHNW